MKTVYYTKDTYQEKSFRVNYFEKDAIKTQIRFFFNEKTQETEQIFEEVFYDKLLFCQRLEWVNSETELDGYIEEMCQYWKNRHIVATARFPNL